MKKFDRILAAAGIVAVLVFALANAGVLSGGESENGRPYRVEVNRLALDIEEKGLEGIDLSQCEYVQDIQRFDGNFYGGNSDYIIREINGELYRFDYLAQHHKDKRRTVIILNAAMGVMAAVFFGLLLYVRRNVLQPFERLVEVPYELSRGNLMLPLKESKSRFFGRFVWGIDLLRENIEQQKQRELELQREKKRLLLSLSHDIKTPLSAIKLYARALSGNLYPDSGKQLEIAGHIQEKADEIEGYVSRIIRASKEDFLSFDVEMGEFYLSDLVERITAYYGEKFALVKTKFLVGEYRNCLLEGDPDRSVEVVQNVIENALKYGDGRWVELLFAEEEGCVLFSVKNSGCTLADFELPHIFESFWRGANAQTVQGSGLGLYICRQLMHKMKGEIFAEAGDGNMTVTAVFGRV